MTSGQQRPLLSIRGDASAEEVAALTVVLQALAAARSSAVATPPPAAWSANHRKVRTTHRARPGGWRESGLPR